MRTIINPLSRVRAPQRATTTNQAYLTRLQYNSLADIAFFEIPDGLKEVDEDNDDYSNMDYIGHGLEEPRPQFHGCGMIAREIGICHR